MCGGLCLTPSMLSCPRAGPGAWGFWESPMYVIRVTLLLGPLPASPSLPACLPGGARGPGPGHGSHPGLLPASTATNPRS